MGGGGRSAERRFNFVRHDAENFAQFAAVAAELLAEPVVQVETTQWHVRADLALPAFEIVEVISDGLEPVDHRPVRRVAEGGEKAIEPLGPIPLRRFRRPGRLVAGLNDVVGRRLRPVHAGVGHVGLL